jgi:hypothetical protein
MFKRLKKKGKAHNEVLVACARKLLTVVWSVLRSDRPFTTDQRLLARSAAMAQEVEDQD